MPKLLFPLSIKNFTGKKTCKFREVSRETVQVGPTAATSSLCMPVRHVKRL